ncbi:MAG: aminotransferase class V-fold PLP-dependent enzyme, partial [Clostridia bacterium]|nr:aminotransferase class V-fold PLP-dependent enzyme [Clostridia bacterium]
FTACGIDPVLLGNKLSEKGVCVRAGLHCAPEAHKTVGTLDSGTVRMSVSAFTRKTEVFEFCKILNSIIK